MGRKPKTLKTRGTFPKIPNVQNPKQSKKPRQLKRTMKPKKLPIFQLKDIFEAPPLRIFLFQLEGLPDEVLLNVLSFLELPDLNRCEQVSKRLKSVVQIESLWQKLIFFNNTRPIKINMPINFVEKILDRGCKTLCLKRYRLTQTRRLVKKPGLNKLINLNLHQCELPSSFLEKLLSSSHSLKKLALTKYHLHGLSYDVLSNFFNQNGQTLQTLNLVFTNGVRLELIELIIKNCTGLKEIDLSGCCQSEACTSLLVNGITKSIEKFGLGFRRYGSDSADGYITTLVSRCNKIKSLNLGYRFI